MVHIKPFKGVRPRKDIAHLVAAPPYDVLSSEEARVMAGANPYSFLHVGKPEIDLPPGTDIYSDEVYAKAKENFERFFRENVLFQDNRENFYIYKQVWGNHVQVGLVAAASCEDYIRGIIKKHELTRPEKENDRMRHIETLASQTGPVFLTYRQSDAIDGLVAESMQKAPEYEFTTADGVHHVFFVVNDDGLIFRITAEFKNLSHLYVADGHHRSAAAARIRVKRQEGNPHHTGMEAYNFFLTVVFPHDQMKILPYNRAVRDLNGLGASDFLAKVDEFFDRRPSDRTNPARSKEFCMFIEETWSVLQAKPGSFDAGDPVASLDVSILQHNLLAPILGIRDPRTDNRIAFIGGIRGTGELESMVRSGDYQVAFSLFPTTIGELFAVADSGKIMPPKSTWFEPKLKDGLASHMIST